MKVKANDTVIVIAGKDKGKQGRVKQACQKPTKLLLKVLMTLKTSTSNQMNPAVSKLKHLFMYLTYN